MIYPLDSGWPFKTFTDVKTARFTSGPQTLDGTHNNVFCDTDGGAFTINLPAGNDGRNYRIINSGSSGNGLTIAPNGTELLLGANSSITITDSNIVILVFDSVEGWW